jgi:hypothetical protein
MSARPPRRGRKSGQGEQLALFKEPRAVTSDVERDNEGVPAKNVAGVLDPLLLTDDGQALVDLLRGR